MLTKGQVEAIALGVLRPQCKKARFVKSSSELRLYWSSHAGDYTDGILSETHLVDAETLSLSLKKMFSREVNRANR